MSSTSEDLVSRILDAVRVQPSEALESETLEFKEYSSESALHNAKDLTDEIVALCNKLGGMIIIGVRDSSNVANKAWSSQIVGFPEVDLLQTKARLKGKIGCPLDLQLEEVRFEGKNFLVIRVPRVSNRLVATTSGKVYIRDGRSSRPMSPAEIEESVKSLTSYDWTADVVDGSIAEMLDASSVASAMNDFRTRRVLDVPLDEAAFLEAIGATTNGSLTKAGLLFFGRKEALLERVGLLEFRFSWKTPAGLLKINDIWTDNLWSTVDRARRHFRSCNHSIVIKFEGQEYPVPLLDEEAFHEAFMNALVHRDYSTDGMVAVDYDSAFIRITSPGDFYGGVSPENIYRHVPRHRNKALAKLMMSFQLVDRAGMGVQRMSLRSLKYGRAFPVFSVVSDSVQVSMQAEYLRAGIFVVAMSPANELSLAALVILNSVYEIGFVRVDVLLAMLERVVDDPWNEIVKAVDALPYVELCATRSDVYVRVVTNYANHFEVDKNLRASPVSERLVKLFKYLHKHGSASNSDITQHLGYKYGTQTSEFLKKTKFVKRQGNGPKATWILAR